MNHPLKQIGTLGASLCLLTAGCGGSDRQENAAFREKLDSLTRNIKVIQAEPHPVALDESDRLSSEQALPSIVEDDYAVTGQGEVDLLVFSSPEKAGSGKDSWMKELAEQFNRENHVLSDGHTASVSVVSINSGLGCDYLTSQTAIPDLFSPSSALWLEVLKEKGIEMKPLLETTVHNQPGIAISKTKYSNLKETGQPLSLSTLVSLAADGKLIIGYTDPFTSTTGLNFLSSILETFDSQDPLSETARSDFRTFQENIPFVASNTQQMLKAASNGTFDAFVIEQQQMTNTPELAQSYLFVPFGTSHDKPLYQASGLDASRQEAAQLFANLLQSEQARQMAAADGFNRSSSQSGDSLPDGKQLLGAQQLWKEDKDSSRHVAAIFVADASGSMEGPALEALKRSLINGMKYICEDCSIGLMSYTDSIILNTPIAPFDPAHQEEFKGAVQSLKAGGGTATYVALAAAMDQMEQYVSAHPELDIKPMIFLLSDGETNQGFSFKDIELALDLSDYPVYTIGYNANIPALKKISDLNEAASISADSDDIISTIKRLFNATL